MKNCPECGSKKFVIRNGEQTCVKCGLVVNQGYFSGKMMLI